MPKLRLEPAERIVTGAYVALTVVMWPSPLLGLLHAESSAVAAGTAFFATGLLALSRGAGRAPGRVVARALLLALVPGALLTVSLLWRPNCAYGQGLAFYLLFVPPATGLGGSMAWAIAGLRVRFPRLLFISVGLVAAAAPIVLGPGLHPQFFVHSGVWGGVSGPIYDEELIIRPGLLAHRAQIVLWIAWLASVGSWLRARRGLDESRPTYRPATRATVIAGALISVALGATYLLGPRLGIVTTRSTLESHFTGRVETDGFSIHYEAESLAPFQARVIAETLRFRWSRYAGVLGVAPRGPIQVYMFSDPEGRARLTGARFTSVVPVWLRVPQIHVLHDAATPDVLAHELAHVFSREFGMPVLRGSPAVGLVEGLAVALEPPTGLPTLGEQVAAARTLAPDDAGRLSSGPSDAVVGAMSPLGFWTGRGGVSYVTTGAFTKWLIARYGAARLRTAYRCGDFETAYGRSVGALAADWQRSVARIRVTPEAVALARWRFSQPSILERRCPHHVPTEERLVRAAATALDGGRIDEAGRLYRQALDARDLYLPAIRGLAGLALGQGRAAEAAPMLERAVVDTLDPGVLVLLGDARRILGDRTGADRAYRAARRALPPYAHEARVWLSLRTSVALSTVRLLHVPGRHAEIARLLDRLGASRDSGASALFAAERWIAAGRPDRAYASMRAISEPENRARAGAIHAWRARYARLAGDPETAASEAAAAAGAYNEAGLSAAAAEQRDRAAEARWVAGRPASLSYRQGARP